KNDKVFDEGSSKKGVHAKIQAKVIGKKSTSVEIMSRYTNQCKHCTVLRSTCVCCNPEDEDEINDFADWIMNIGEGKIDGKNDGHAKVEFPEEMPIPDFNDHIESLITETYDNWQHNL
ncbi:ATP-dependent DNA helicase PIF1-like protein, partial [Tanacetum coccineum]